MAPELLGLKSFSGIIRTVFQDSFSMGIILYYLLFNSYPFGGMWIGPGDPPPPKDLIQDGQWVHSPSGKLRPAPITIPLEVVHPDLQRAFARCFTDGHRRPESRPSAREWTKYLQTALADLTSCNREPGHYYSKIYGRCYWCDRKQNLGFDIFPTSTSGIRHLPTTPKSIITPRPVHVPPHQGSAQRGISQGGLLSLPSRKSIQPVIPKPSSERRVLTISVVLLTILLGLHGWFAPGDASKPDSSKVSEPPEMVVLEKDVDKSSSDCEMASHTDHPPVPSTIQILCYPWAKAKLTNELTQDKKELDAPMKLPVSIPSGSYNLTLFRNGSSVLSRSIELLPNQAYKIRIRLDLKTFTIDHKEDGS